MLRACFDLVDSAPTPKRSDIARRSNKVCTSLYFDITRTHTHTHTIVLLGAKFLIARWLRMLTGRQGE